MPKKKRTDFTKLNYVIGGLDMTKNDAKRLGAAMMFFEILLERRIIFEPEYEKEKNQ
jgi:hypothetical protein